MSYDIYVIYLFGVNAMNSNDVMILKESMSEYCEEIFGICIGYMTKYNINMDLSGEDELSILLREVKNIQDAILEVDEYAILNKYRKELLTLNSKVRDVIR